MGQALYRKHRPKSLSEVVGQEHITDTLGRVLKKGTVSHAYLLTGPRGTGKTSVARILAYEVNGLPYDEEATHLDIIEIDAASNRRIDEIRELKERVNIAPTSAKYKVYIIDEVHMLTKEAFNALLKTLEEPPEHAIFILATTEAHKVPETIISRTQRFTFKPVEMDKVIKHLQQIAKTEDIVIEDSALGLIAAHGQGSFRDSISLLDQVRHTSNAVSLKDVQQAIGQAPDELLDNLTTAISSGEIQTVARGLEALRTHGTQAPQVARQLSALLRSRLLSQPASLPSSQILELLADLLQIPASNDPALALELATYKSALKASQPTARSSPPITAPKGLPNIDETPPKLSESPPKNSVSPSTLTNASQQNETGFFNEQWQEVLAVVKTRHNTLYGVARMGVPSFSPGKLTLTFAFAFHQKKLNDSKNKHLLTDIITEVTGNSITLECVLDTSAETPALPLVQEIAVEAKSVNDLNLATISNIFGGAEIVE